MKKLWKALVGIFAAVAMLFAGGTIAATASADEPRLFALGRATSYTVSIENSVAGYTYEAYQIFAGNVYVKDDKKTLSDITWGTGVTDEGQTALQKKYEVNSAAALAEKLTTGDLAKQFAKDVTSYLTDMKVTSSRDGQTYKISDLQSGYYLIKNSENGVPAGGSYTEYILEVVGDVTATPKGDVPEVTKKVRDINDSTDTAAGDWQDSADHDLNDKVPFQLTGTMPTIIDSYSSYKYVFHDTLSKGLTYNADSIHVYAVSSAGKVELKKVESGTDGYVVTSGTTSDTESAYQGGATLTISFDDIKKAVAAKDTDTVTIDKDTKIVVEYTATLNENAVIGSAGNPNKVYLEFSNDPNGGDTTANTPEDKVVVFTYELTVNKTDGSNALNGAAFKLEKKYKALPDGVSEGDEDWTFEGEDSDKVYWKTVKAYTASEAQSSFEFSGLDDGNYRLTETATPEGYNSIDPINFTIEATHNEKSDDPKLLTFKVTGFSTEIDQSSNPTGSAIVTVVNKAGSDLPSTGGMGTTILYAAGAVIVIAAALGLTVVLRKHQSLR